MWEEAVSEMLSRIFSSRVFYIIFSLIISAVLWMYVEINENSPVTHRIDNIPIEFLNEDVFHDRNLVIASISPQTITLTLDCPRSVASRLNSKTVTASVDLANISSNGYYPQPYTIVYPSDVNTDLISRTTRSVGRISMTIDIMHKRDIPVEVSYNGGTSSSEYIAETPDFNPKVITVFGPEAIVSQIERARVPIVRENLSTTYTDDLEFVLIDKDGEELEDSAYAPLTFSQDTIRVTVPISMLKEVSLTVDFVYGAGATQQNTKYVVNPPFITISGDPDAISDVNSIFLGTIDVTKFDYSYSEAFPIIVQNTFKNESNVLEALVSVDVLGLEIKHLSVTALRVVNTPRDLEPYIITQSVDVRIRGVREELDRLTFQGDMEGLTSPLNIRVVADLSGYSSGSQVVPARVYIDGDFGDIGAIGDYKITVSLRKVQ